MATANVDESPSLLLERNIAYFKDTLLLLHYPDAYQPCKPVVLQQTWVPNSLLMGANYVDYEPQGTEVIQACLQTTP